MKILWACNVYPEALDNVFFEMKRNEQDIFSYQELKKRVDASYINYFATGWCEALQEIGYETENIVVNADPLQKLWLAENSVHRNDLSLEEILLLQIKAYRPDILFVGDICSTSFLRQVKKEVASIRLIIGWAGSAVAKERARQELWGVVDVVLCCAPESVSYLRRKGANAVHMNHAFPLQILSVLNRHGKKCSEISFIGSVVRGEDYHLFREKLLLELLEALPLDIYSPSAMYKKRDFLRAALAGGLYDLVHPLPSWMKESFFSRIPFFNKACAWKERPRLPVNRKLYKYMQPAVYGIDMFDALWRSNIALNIHADSSPEFASNMRLYEATGVGVCLLTDNKKNMKELFTPNQEVVAYDSLEDCVEKAIWLNEHPKERQGIAEAGARRCLKEHTYRNRAIEFDRIIRDSLRSKPQ